MTLFIGAGGTIGGEVGRPFGATWESTVHVDGVASSGTFSNMVAGEASDNTNLVAFLGTYGTGLRIDDVTIGGVPANLLATADLQIAQVSAYEVPYPVDVGPVEVIANYDRSVDKRGCALFNIAGADMALVDTANDQRANNSDLLTFNADTVDPGIALAWAWKWNLGATLDWTGLTSQNNTNTFFNSEGALNLAPGVFTPKTLTGLWSNNSAGAVMSLSFKPA